MTLLPRIAIRGIILLLLGVAAFISVVQGFRNAVQYSQDFQWSPTTIFVAGENPYEHYLSGNHDNRIILSQEPVYAHALYVLLSPIAKLRWRQAKIVWAAFNISAAVFIAMLVGRRFGLSGYSLWWVLFVFLAGTPFRNGVGNGQQSTFTLLAFCALLYPKTIVNSFWVGFGYIKYSFAPPLAIYLTLKRGITHTLISLLPVVLGYLIFIVHVGGNPITVLLQPLKVSAIASVTDAGTADLASVLSSGRTGTPFIFAYFVLPLVFGIGLVLCICGFVREEHLGFALLCVIETICFRHHRL
jgi:glycosyl transferase family 87